MDNENLIERELFALKNNIKNLENLLMKYNDSFINQMLENLSIDSIYLENYYEEFFENE